MKRITNDEKVARVAAAIAKVRRMKKPTIGLDFSCYVPGEPNRGTALGSLPVKGGR